MAKIKFTAGRVDAFTCDSDKSSSFLWDSVAPGLGLRVTPNGSKSYVFQAKLRGQVIRKTIGPTTAWTIPNAQAEASRLRVLINRGQDPRQVEADGLAAEQVARRVRAAAEAAVQAEQAILDQEKAAEETKQKLLARTAWDAYLAAPHPKWGEQHRADHRIAASEGGIKTKVGEGHTKAAPLASLLRQPLYAITAPVVQEWLASECASRPTFAHNSFRKFRTFIRWCSKQPRFQAVTHLDCCLTDEVKDIVPVSKTKEGDSLQREQLKAMSTVAADHTFFALLQFDVNPFRRHSRYRCVHERTGHFPRLAA